MRYDEAQVAEVATEVLGFPSLRPGQLEAICSVVEGHDTLAVMATGAGKSAVYQIAGLLIPGPTVVVSPLLSLQRDQLEMLARQTSVPAVALNSAARKADRRSALETIRAGSAEYVFLSPEQLGNPEVLAELQEAPPSLFVVDEAHLVSEWGKDFRPEYLRLGGAATALGRPPILALTATAAPPVRTEILERLGMVDAKVMVRGFDRPNISLAVETYFTTAEEKLDAVVERVVESSGAGIVYVGTQRGSAGLATALRERGVRAEAYHAGLGGRRRERTEVDFRTGAVDVVVATVAFGMGIDKPDVRWVFHADISGSVDEYYQELGRAGRDGLDAEAVLFYRPEDLRLRRLLAARTGTSRSDLERVASAAGGGDDSLTELQRSTTLSRPRTTAAAVLLADSGGLVLAADGGIKAGPTMALEAAVEASVERVARRKVGDMTRIDTVRGYAEELGCRRAYLLRYFGEAYEGPCGNCDNDERAVERSARAAEEDHPFDVNGRVSHVLWGEGEVLGYHGGKVLVLFGDAGYKRIALRDAEESLTPTPV